MRSVMSMRCFNSGELALVLAGIFALCACQGVQRDKLPAVVDYNFHIRPILSDKCFKCHGPDANERQADLRLDMEAGLYQHSQDDQNSFVVVPGKVDESMLLHRIESSDSMEMMPPPESNLALSDLEKRLVRKWIEQGASYKDHWAFIPPEEDVSLASKGRDWTRNEIDHFILQAQEEHGLMPNDDAAPALLLKRLSLDLTGLPPDLDLQQSFLQNPSEEVYAELVDHLLESPHYGERMALHWMDVARYADSHGYQDDGLRTMWPWRDWVIHAFNQNYSYDKFLTWQLAGDLLEEPTKEMLLATGFNRNHKITQEGGVIDEEYRIEYVTDRTNTFGKAFLGITFECAKCHDHKYDPISQADYFRAFAFFNKLPEKGIVGTIDASFADPPNMEITDADAAGVLSFVNKQDTGMLEVMIMHDSSGIRATHVLDRGAYDAPTDKVRPGMPDAILPYDTTQYGTDRLGLAQWLLDEKNPLTARVFVNRIWQELFGRGLVKTSGDYGMQGELPSHPQLLDWLALDFREHGWDIKRLMKQLVMSSTYRQSAESSKGKRTKDPDNIWLSHAPRLRLPAEVVRDQVLSSAGLLESEIGGPSVKPYEPSDIWSSATSGRGLLQSYIQDHGSKLYRRGMYTFIKRTIPPPTMLMFDASNRDQCEVRRLTTNTPLQALAMLNDKTVLEASRVLAQRLVEEHDDLEEAIAEAAQRILCRSLDSDETQLFNEYATQEYEFFAKSPEKAEALIDQGEYPQSSYADRIQLATLMQLIHTMYNLEEAIMKT